MEEIRSASRWSAAPRLEARFAQAGDAVREAQRLRHWLLRSEAGAQRAGPGEPIDEDRFDAHCEHLLVRDLDANAIVATYRILSPERAWAAGGYHAELAFDLDMLRLLRERMVEIGRTCIHPDYRPGFVTTVLWASLSRFLIERGYDYVLATASLSIVDGGHRAASVCRALAESHASPIDLRARPRERLPVEHLRDALAVATPPMLQAYLDLGAWICGEPALDPESNVAVVPLLLPLARMRARHAREFLAHAA